MTEGGNAGVNMEHEVREAELNARRQDRQEIPLTPRELFKPSFLSERGIRTVMTRGIAGIGSTILLQKFIVDWVEEKANQDIQYVFTFPFRELNLVKSEKQSLLDLICLFYTEMKEMDFIEARDCKVLFIFEDLDDYRYPLHFQSNERWHDVNAKTSVDMLLTNLIRGSLLPSALVWITARPAASEMIPADCINLLTQVRGFTDVQKKRYFRKKFRDQTEATRLLAHLNSSRSLYIMCHIPLFSWIIATVFERRFAVTDREEKNTSVTQLFAHYVILQTSIKNSKYHGGNSSIPRWTDDDRDYLLKIGKLAYQQLEKGATEFNADDIKACGLDVVEATVRSGLITELFSGMNTMFQQRVFCFVHLSIQEFLAALYVFMYFRLNHRNILDSPVVPPITRLFKEPTLVELLKIAVDKALQSPNGHLDMFLRFLLGLAPDSSLELFRSFIPLTGSSAQSVEETAQYIRKKIRENAYPDRSVSACTALALSLCLFLPGLTLNLREVSRTPGNFRK
ncbi:hypothetical protein JZ751_005452 [Albula glossodonta]|uniref:NACHT domain-containing protein n=1 Tax=Albula glossodonta TaxID=121402 RepID=A0A8T2NC47_9TELE|nr:hypothetical protein JZ751_005452 [Albula glossodonta]